MDRKTIEWTNRIEIVDGFLRRKQLDMAREYAKKILNMENAKHMLTSVEIEYLQLIISLDTLEDFINKRKKDK